MEQKTQNQQEATADEQKENAFFMCKDLIKEFKYPDCTLERATEISEKYSNLIRGAMILKWGDDIFHILDNIAKKPKIMTLQEHYEELKLIEKELNDE